MKETVESVSQWAEETFGACTPEAALKRAIEEMDELVEWRRWALRAARHNSIELVEEAADVCITLYRYIYLVDPDAIEKKMAVNRARVWKMDGDGTGQHVKEYDERETSP
jgi:NTP pyrophosphatase (non-canonical NTP hydrolase)